jgi:hypothetical protein
MQFDQGSVESKPFVGMRADEFLSVWLSYGHAHQRPLNTDFRLEILREA